MDSWQLPRAFSCKKCFVVGGFHKFHNIISRVVVFVVDLGIAEEAGISPFFKDGSGYV